MIRKFVRREHSAPKPIKTVLINAGILPFQMMLPGFLMFLGVTFLVQAGIIPQTMTMPEPNRPTKDLKIEAPVNPASQLLEAHRADCWTGSQKAKAELPGAAIVQFVKGGHTVYTKRHILVDAAFNEVLAEVGYGDKKSDVIDVVALCK